MQIKTLLLQTSRLKQLTDFYMRLMELPVKWSGQKEITINIGCTELIFQQGSAGDPFYHFAINIPANKIQEAKVWLKDRVDLIWIEQYKSDITDFVNWHAKSVYFYDTAGNILELIARFDLHNQMNEPFSSSQMLSISEAGLVFSEDEFDKRTDNLLRQYQLSYFSKQPPLPQFRAVGDDDGLFVIVPGNRNWFPTAKPAGIFPMEIEFENENTRYRLALRA